MIFFFHNLGTRYGKCSKILNTFLFLFFNRKKCCLSELGLTNSCQNSKQGKPWSDCLIWVYTVCLGRFVRQLLFEISEHLPLPTFINLYHLCSTSEGTGENACVCPGMTKHFLLASAIHCIIRIYQQPRDDKL